MLHAHCVIVVSDCPLFDDSTFLSFLTIFSLITLSFLLPVNFIFQDAEKQVEFFPFLVKGRVRGQAPEQSVFFKEQGIVEKRRSQFFFVKVISCLTGHTRSRRRSLQASGFGDV